MTSNLTQHGFDGNTSASSSSTNDNVIGSTFDDNYYSWSQPQRVIHARQTKLYLEPFSDNMVITASYLQHSNRSYPIKYLKTIQIIKLQGRPSIITQKITNLLGLIAISIGLVLVISPVLLLFRLFGLLNIIISMIYLARFYWNIAHQKNGEYGLLIEIHHDIPRVITSNSLKAIQMTYRAILERLENSEPITGLLFVDMYTGEVQSNCQ